MLPAFAAERTLVPLADFLRDPDFQGASLSPDGVHLATTRMSNGHTVLQVPRVKGLEPVGAFGLKGDKDVEDVYWPNNEQVMFGLARRLGGVGKPQLTSDLMVVKLNGSGHKALLSRPLTDEPRFRDWDLIDLLRDDPEHVLISRYDYRDPGLNPNVYRMNVRTGNLAKLFQADVRLAGFVSDGDGNVRMMVGTERDGTVVVKVRETADSGWKEMGRYEPGKGALWPSSLAREESQAYMWGNVDAATLGLFRTDLKTGKSELLFRDPVHDGYSLIRGQDRRHAIGVSWESTRTEWKFFDDKHPDAQFLIALRKALGDKDMAIWNFNDARTQAVVSTGSDVEPTSFYVVDLERKAVLARLPTRSWIKPAQMAPMQPIEFKARDGLAIRGYLTLPVDRAPDQKLPMIVLPHGGPIGIRDQWGWDREVQLLANRGYAVLQPNFRGSGGYGRDFENAGMKEFGGKMQEDVTDATRWAIQQGYADPARICIYGTSYGAYAAMMGAIQEPELYKCAAGYAGRYDLVHKVFGEYKISEGKEWTERALGKDEADLKRRSPAYNAEKLQVPLFLAHGEEDKVCPLEQYETMRKALKSAGRNFEEMVKEDEGHGFVNPKNVEEFYTRLLAFFDRNIGKPAAAKTAAN